MNGILNINKPAGLTSHDVVMRIRRVFKGKKVGHTGTLDPIATGVLPVCIGQGTRIAQFLSADSKEYRAVGRLGLKTDTLDKTGQVLDQHEFQDITQAQLQEVLVDFTGEIEQIPPMFSAIKKNGQPLYKLARKGVEVERPVRQVNIYSLKLVDFYPPYFTLDIDCSSGTYIRSLIADIGNKLDCSAIMCELVRTRCGKFKLDSAITLDEVKELAAQKQLDSCLTTMNDALDHIPQAIVNESAIKLIQNGVALAIDSILELSSEFLEEGTLLRLTSVTGELLSVGRALQNLPPTDPTTAIIHPQLVFPSEKLA